MQLAQVKRFTVDEYHRLAELGFFHEDDRVELIRGEIIQMSPKGTLDSTCCNNLLMELAVLLANRAKLRCQYPIKLTAINEPEPDFTTVRQRSDNYLSAHPNPTDVLVVIEIAGSSLKYDQ